MKWGRKKPQNLDSPPPLPSSRPSFMSHILPVSWFSKLNQKKTNQEPIPRNLKGRNKRNSPGFQSPDYAIGNVGRFYSGDDADFWKLSFGVDNVNAKKSEEISRSALYDSGDEQEFRRLSCRSCRSKCNESMEKEEIQNLNSMVSRMARRRRRREAPTEMKILRREFQIESRTHRSRDGENGNLNLGREVLIKKGSRPQRESNKAKEIARKLVGKDVLKVEEDSGIRTIERDKTKSTNSRKSHHVPSAKSRNSHLGTIRENCVFSSPKAEESGEVGTVGIEIDSEWERMKELKIEEMKSRNERQRKPVYLRKEGSEKSPRCRRKVRVYSPRTATKIEICKIKALEDMKKAKSKMKKKVKEKAETDLESFAVVKCSFDPQQDFRDSMVEMIMEKRISKAEELEELLACYLTLNSDQYHDLIIKVFRQVWFDLNQSSFSSELENQFSCNEQILS